MSISTRTRFEILKRDSFRCRYCGATPKLSELRVDHIVPRVSGGPDHPDNLVTACHSCNAGKGPVGLSEFRYPPVPTKHIHHDVEFEQRTITALEQAYFESVLTAEDEITNEQSVEVHYEHLEWWDDLQCEMEQDSGVVDISEARDALG